MILFNAISLYSAVYISWYGVSTMMYYMSLLYLNLKELLPYFPQLLRWVIQGHHSPLVLVWLKNIDCRYSLELPHWGFSNEFIHSVYRAKISKIYNLLPYKSIDPCSIGLYCNGSVNILARIFILDSLDHTDIVNIVTKVHSKNSNHMWSNLLTLLHL